MGLVGDMVGVAKAITAPKSFRSSAPFTLTLPRRSPPSACMLVFEQRFTHLPSTHPNSLELLHCTMHPAARFSTFSA